ncbi:SDR family NAD(P)-dependent oxidoreductase [Alterisphingorhabdus coralli]|uniref:SDR family NAD(P)-dependent oxidoreductase n=1 Tax=Alterisphingorhabdus coralli TaxID=3071408 RepID=A0AA97I150_9SPHN|nr:SDR family NAD(P)-dependent oxidoreductase [Parasphingorhabdus sp. SCSIO 66989]WOE74910.1 SDR family NAD(P)-dependent oxidoreductase [Parasphingorhabdus sp. SCSIO 66989]
MDFSGKTIWITGASSGIGEALARAFAAEGAKLILSGRRQDALDALAKELDTETTSITFDTTDWDALPGAVEKAVAWQGHVDILVNNAGISQRSLAVDTAPHVYEKILDTDLLAPIWLTQLLLPHMVKHGSGHMVAISSVAGRAGIPLRTAYCAAKHGIIGYSDALRAETSQAHNIGVTTVLPGSVQTDVARNALTGDGARHEASDDSIENGLTPEECVRQILEGMKNGVPEIVVAQDMERGVAEMRHNNPEMLFQMTAAMGAKLAGESEG